MKVAEVYPAPTVSSTRGEYVVLYNEGGSGVSLSGYVLETAGDRIVLPDITLPPQASFMVADSGFVKDNATWPDPDLNSSMTLRNADGWVALEKGNTTEENISWHDAVQGMAFADGNWSMPLPRSIPTSFARERRVLSVGGSQIAFTYSLDSDMGTDEPEIMFYPGQERTITLNLSLGCSSAVVEWLGDSEYLESNGSFSSERAISQATAPGAYTIDVYFCNETRQIPFRILPTVGMDIEEGVLPCAARGLSGACTGTATVSNIGNVPMRLTIIPEGETNLSVTIDGEPLSGRVDIADAFSIGETREIAIAASGNATALPLLFVAEDAS